MMHGEIQNGMIMNNPLGPTIGPGYFSDLSNHNKEKDLKNIIDKRREFKKKLTSFNLPRKVYVINLPERQDRWESFKSKNQSIFEAFETSRIDGIVGKDVQKSIFQSHLSCLREAFKTEDCVIVMEDDCYVAEGWLEKITSTFRELPEDWDVLIGNHYFFSTIDILTDNIAKPNGKASTANFVIYNKSSLNKIEKNIHLSEDPHMRDIDHFLTSERSPVINYTIWPMVSREYVSVSDHYKNVRNMEFRIRENSNMFQYIDSDTYYPSIDCW